jgi:hypothetical protein
MTWENFINETDPYLCAQKGCKRDKMKGSIFCEWHDFLATLLVFWKIISFPFILIFVGLAYLWYRIFGLKLKF